MIDDPFGQRTVRANMHPGYQNPDVIGPAGPVDPASDRCSRSSPATAGRSPCWPTTRCTTTAPDRSRPTTSAGSPPRSPGGSVPTQVEPPVRRDHVAGHQRRPDVDGLRPAQEGPGPRRLRRGRRPRRRQAYQAIAYHDWVPLAMAETTLVLGRRVPDEARLAWAQGSSSGMGKRLRCPPRNLPEVYAKEAIFLHEEPRRELKLQAIRIGELGIAAIPNEVFAITGLKIKAQSPFDTTMNIELANGSEGYIPPPEQHALGGYTTWPARTAGLEVQAEPKIVAAVLELLEQGRGQTAAAAAARSIGAYAQAVLASKPLAYWRLDDIEGTNGS